MIKLIKVFGKRESGMIGKALEADGCMVLKPTYVILKDGELSLVYYDQSKVRQAEEVRGLLAAGCNVVTVLSIKKAAEAKVEWVRS